MKAQTQRKGKGGHSKVLNREQGILLEQRFTGYCSRYFPPGGGAGGGQSHK